MLLNPRRQRYFKSKIVGFLLLLFLLTFLAFGISYSNNWTKPLFLNPVAKIEDNKLKLEKLLKEKKIEFSNIALFSNFYLIDVKDNGQVRIALNKDFSKQLSSLQKILFELTIEGKPFRSIDFRFDEPVISF